MSETDLTDPTTPPAVEQIIAGPDPGYRWKHLLVSIALIAVGGWFAYDGLVRWPAENARAAQVQMDEDKAKDAHDTTRVEALAKELSQLKHHTNLDLLLQKMLATVLPAAGLIWGFWTLRETRGQYRMEGGTLHIPGHPAITYENIRRIDKRKWDRKGIAFIHYEHGNPPMPAVMKLDDFAYDRKMTDAILGRIEQNVMPSNAPRTEGTV